PDPIAQERIEWLKGEAPCQGDYVVYWMQQSQRAWVNHALEFAIQQANQFGKPLWVLFGLMPDYPEANARHYLFMLQGLKATEADLRKRNIRFVLQFGQPADLAVKASEKA